MFNFMKRDRDKDKKERKDRKREKKKDKERERPFTTSERNRLEEAKPAFEKNSFERKILESEDHRMDGSPTGSMCFRDRSETESSEASFTLDKTKDSSPGSSVGKKLDPGRKIYSPTKGPPVPPKPSISRGILKGTSCYGPEIPNQGVHGNIDDTEVLVSNTLANETLPIKILHNHNEPIKTSEQGVTNNEHIVLSPQSPILLTPAGESLGEHGKTFDFELKLPALSPPKLPRSRFVDIKRQTTGDFGFSLRRATILDRGYGDNTEKKRTILYAEPITIGKSNTTGLLPGDRLLEVNGTNVELKSRDEVIDLIKNSGEVVTLKVQTVLELSELTMRPGLDGSDIPLDENQVKEGSLQRSGSKRYKQTAKTEDQLSSDQQLLEDDQVWLVHKGGFAAARLLKPSSPSFGPPVSEGMQKVKLEHNGQILEVEIDDVEKANPSKLDRVEDLVQLHYLNESSFLHTLRQRYGSNLIHTYAGLNMIVVNPMHPLSIYSEKVIQMFKGCKSEDMPPHIYATAQNALRQMISTRKDQSIVLMGRSGSGKTTNFKYLLHYLALATETSVSVVTVEKLNAIGTLMEAFGHCRTVLNTSATCFTQLFSMDFDHYGQIVSGSIQISMLEKIRLIRRPEGESTFYIFYQLLAGCDPSQRNELILNNLSEPCIFMTPLQRTDDKNKACMAWARILAACDVLGIKTEESKAIWCVLAAIYHLGVASAVQGANNTKGMFSNPAAAQKAATLLGITPEELSRRVFNTSQTLAVRTSFRSSSDKVTLPEKPLDAVEALEGMVVGLYCETFATLVALINRALSSNYRTQSSILILDSPGFQNPASCGRSIGATFEEFYHNYFQEKLQLLFHDLTFTLQQDRYIQENIDCDLASALTSTPEPMVILMDKPSQQSLMRSPSLDRNRNSNEERGLLWVLDEEAIFPGSSDDSFIDRVLTLHQQQIKKKNGLLKRGSQSNQLILQHFQGTNPVVYNVNGWLKSSRDYIASKNAAPLLQETQKEEVRNLFSTFRGPCSGGLSGSCAGIEFSHSLRRVSSIWRTNPSTANIKRKSVCLQVKFQVDAIIDILRRTKVHFVHCILPQHNAGLCDLKTSLLMPNKTNSQEDIMLNVPLVRSQLRGFQIIDAVRCHKQGYPEQFSFGEFRHRFSLLATSEENVLGPILNDKQMVENLLSDIDLEKTSYKLGLSQIFFRAGALAQLEDARDKKITGTIIQLQSYCRGYLRRRKIKKLKVQELAVRCIQKNVRKFLAISTWPWWRLLAKVFPLLNVHRTEEELKAKTEELETLHTKVIKLEKERNDFKQAVDRLEVKLSDLSAEYVEELSTSTNAAELLDAETAELMKLEKALEELQIKYAALQQKCGRMEMEVMEARMLRVTDINGDLDDDENEYDSVYRPKYERAVRELDFTKKKMQQQMEDAMEQRDAGKKQLERKLAEVLEETEEQRQLAISWKRKAQRAQSEMQDIQLLLEEHTSRNADLEKRQRKFDTELAKIHDEVRQEKFAKEKIQREKELILTEKYTLDHELEKMRADFDSQKEKIDQLESEIRDLSDQPQNDMEIIQLKKGKHELEIKVKDQEEELDDLAGQVQMLEQTKLRLEVGTEKLRQQHQKELEVKEEEVEELRASTQKRVKQLEQQLEDEYEERHSLTKTKLELERKLHDLSERVPKRDAMVENRMKKDLRRTKALLRDAQTMLQNSKDNAPSRALIKQLKNQLEDADFAKVSATKAKQSVEMELQELQQQLDDALKSKATIEDKCMQLTREKNDLQSHLDDDEEELQDIMKKYKATVSQVSIDQITLNDQSTHISELLNEKEQLKEQLATASSKVEYLEENTVDRQHASRLEIKVKELETKLELEQTTRHRLEVQISRLKESIDKLISENASLKSNEEHAQEVCKRLERQLRDLKEDFAELQRKEAEASQRKHDLEMALENAEVDHETTRSDLKLAFKRIEDLQAVITDNLASDSEGSLSDSDSESSSEADMFLNHKSSPIRRGGGESPAATPRAKTTIMLSSPTKSELDC